MSQDRYFAINDDVGLDADGNPEPAVTVAVMANVPSMRDGQVVEIAHHFDVAPIAGTRIFKVSDPMVAAQLATVPSLHEIDAPKKTDLSKSREAVQDAKEHAGTHVDPEEKE
jgi:hypothetical protein